MRWFWQKRSRPIRVDEEITAHAHVPVPVEKYVEVADYEIHFNDGEILKVIAAHIDGDRNMISYEDENENTFLTIIESSVKYIRESEEYNLTKNIKCGVFKVKPPKYTSLTKRNRIDTVE